jgi:two-component sensor histidine kinase
MLVHELATNSAKYGSLSNGDAGKVDITWQVGPTPAGNRMRLRWQESGGPQVTLPGRKGFGSRLIQLGLAQDLDGEARLDFESAGVVCRIAMPLPTGDGLMSHE